MWNKKIQILFWGAAYSPVFIIGLYRFFFEGVQKGRFLEIDFIKTFYNKNFLSIKTFYRDYPSLTLNIIDCSIITIIIGLSVLLYIKGPTVIFKNIEKEIDINDVTSNVRKFSKLGYNDYMFFLLTLILPLITVDFSKFTNLYICFLVIVFIILLLVNLNYIIACPLLIFSKFKVWVVDIETEIQGETHILENVFVITPEVDLYNKKFIKKQLLPRIYYLKCLVIIED